MGDEITKVKVKDLKAMTSAQLEEITAEVLEASGIALDEFDKIKEAVLKAEEKAKADAEKQAQVEANNAEANAKAEENTATPPEAPKDGVTDKIAKSNLKKVKAEDGVVKSALRVLASKTLNPAEMADFAESFPSLFE